MADEVLKIDANNKVVSGAVTDDASQEIRNMRIHDATKGLKVKVVGGAGTGDVKGPATNTDSYIPQWDGTNSKTLKNGLAVPAGGLAGITLVDTKQDKFTCISKTADYTAQPFELVNCDVSAASFKVTLPSAPADETQIWVKLNGIGANKYLTIATSGTDKFNTPTGNVEIYMYLFGEYAQCQYCAATGLWTTFISAGTFNFATNFPGIDATTPITNANISIDTSTRVLTITPPLGYFNIFVDGGGVITRYRKVGTINFPAFTDTSGTWFFYFDANGNAVTTQTPWTTSQFPSIATVYRILWNASLVGSAKLVAQYVEYHQNTIPSDTHQWFHLQGTQWMSGFTIANNAITSGTPNANGTNAVIGLTTGTNIDDNLSYTITNNTTGNPFTQDMGNTIPASLDNTNGGQFKIFTQDAGGLVSFIAANRFPFPASAGNVIEKVSSTGVRTTVTDTNFLPVFIYATQNPVSGDAIKVVTWTADFTSITNARAINWIDIQNTYPILGLDPEIRPLYRLIYESRTAYNVTTKKAALREVQDLRKTPTTTTATATGSIPASSVTVVPAGTIAATNAQAALEELDTEKAPLASPSFTGTVALGTSPTMTTPVITGLPTGTGVASAATVSTLMARDANGNSNVVNMNEGYTTTVTSASPVVLTVASNNMQYFTGSTAQTVTLPVTSTLVLGQSYWIINNSSAAVTVNSSGSNAVIILAAGTSTEVTCILTSGTTAASWSAQYFGANAATGKKLTISNSLTLAGTDGTTMTFPSTSATIARTDAANTFTGVQTFSNSINEIKGADIASATTTDIGAATGNFVDVTGTTTITGFGTVQAGTRRIVRFTGALTLTHNATSLILPTGANITTVAGDTATMISLGSGNWVCTSYQRKDGSALVGGSPTYKNGTTTKNAADGSTTQNIAHGLGKIPNKVKLTCISLGSGTSKNLYHATTVYNGTTQSSQSYWQGYTTSTYCDSSFSLATDGSGYNGGATTGVVTFDSTNIIITWTNGGNNPVGTYQILWEAQ